MNYFLTEDDLKKALEEEREFLFTTISRALWELEHKFLLLVDTMGSLSHKSKNKTITKEKKMENEPRATRNFNEVLQDLIDYVLQSEDHDLILLSDELFESAKVEVERREKTTSGLRQIIAKGKRFLKEQGFGEKKEEPSIEDLPEGHKQQIEEKEKKGGD